MTVSPSLREQAKEAELHFLGQRDLLARAEAKQIHRTAEWIENMRRRNAAAEAAYQTLRTVAERQQARMGG